MRLNFSGVGEDDIREGVRRIGEVVREQVGALRHAHRASAAEPPRAAPRRRTDGASPTSCTLPRAATARQRR